MLQPLSGQTGYTWTFQPLTITKKVRFFVVLLELCTFKPS